MKLGISFSLKRALGISAIKQKMAKSVGIPTTKHGVERKIGSAIFNVLFGKRKRRK